MLFDLRSRGRRRTVQVIYVLLALVMVAGLLLVGVGTGSGGGILNAFTNNGSGSNAGSVVAKAQKAALKQTRLHPTSAAAWANLLTASRQKAINAPDVTSKGVITAQGKKDLKIGANAWNKYQALVKTPDGTTASIAAQVLGYLQNYSAEADAWEFYADAFPTAPKGFECLAASAYAAKQTRKGDLAVQQAISISPKASQFELKQQLKSLKTNATSTAESEC